MNYGMMGGAGNMSGWGGMALGGLTMLLWFALLVGLIVLIVKWVSGLSGRNTSRDALDTLERRFALGEIDTAEFEERARQLRTSK